MPNLLHRQIHSNQINLHIVSIGSGPLVIFCHGFPGHWSQWQAQMQAVAAAGFCAIAVDLRGYGESSRPAEVEAYNMDNQIADLCGLLDALNAKEAVFVGQDFGAPLVWNMAIREPDRVTAVIGMSVPFDHDYFGRSGLGHLSMDELAALELGHLLVASPIHPPSVGFNAIAEHQFLHAHYFQQQGLADKELGHHAREFLCRIYWGLSSAGNLGDWSTFSSSGTGYLDVLPAAPALPWDWMSQSQMDQIEAAYLQSGKDNAFSGGLASYRVADINWNIGEAYKAMNVECPALFIAGADDPVMAAVDKDTLKRMQQRIPDLRGIEIIDGAGHFVQMEKSAVCNQVILNFLQTL